LGGIILELILRDKKKDDKNNSRKESKASLLFSLTKSRTLNATSNFIYNDINKSNELKKHFLRIFLVYSLYYFAKIVMNSFDNIGYNRVKY
jgi:hypothetical protein